MFQKKLQLLIPRLGVLTAFCFLIEIFRIIYALNINYIFLPWNLILAWIPMYLAFKIRDENRTAWLVFYLLAWLIFFPNAPYIITDLLHLKQRGNVPFWYDVILLYAYAFTGLTLGIVSAMIVFKKVKLLFSYRKAQLLLFLSMMLSGYGIYLGRFLRYNSWDIVSSPMQIFADSTTRLLHPTTYPGAYGITLMSGALLLLVFLVFESFLLTD